MQEFESIALRDERVEAETEVAIRTTTLARLITGENTVPLKQLFS